MTDIKWGPAIAVDGKRPAWLASDDLCAVRENKDWLGLEGDTVAIDWVWRPVVDFKLPADHPHYRQTEAEVPEGMKAWHGGDAAPADWDGGPVLMRNGSMIDPKGARDAFTWQHTTRDDTRRMPVFDIVAYTPVAAPIDWSGELEAAHEDGRVVRVTLQRGPDDDGDMVTNESLDDEGDTTRYWTEDGLPSPNVEAQRMKWRIRNVSQPTPQADTKPDLTVRAPCMTISEVREMAAKGEDAVIATMLERGYALPEPVDEDLIEAREAVIDAMPNQGAAWADAVRAGQMDGGNMIAIARASRRRALALAGEKEA